VVLAVTGSPGERPEPARVPPAVLLSQLCAVVSPLLTIVAGLSVDLIAGSNVLAGLGGGVLSGILTEVVRRPGKAEEGKTRAPPSKSGSPMR
jgi:hypothetical protein